MTNIIFAFLSEQHAYLKQGIFFHIFDTIKPHFSKFNGDFGDFSGDSGDFSKSSDPLFHIKGELKRQ